MSNSFLNGEPGDKPGAWTPRAADGIPQANGKISSGWVIRRTRKDIGLLDFQTVANKDGYTAVYPSERAAQEAADAFNHTQINVLDRMARGGEFA